MTRRATEQQALSRRIGNRIAIPRKPRGSRVSNGPVNHLERISWLAVSLSLVLGSTRLAEAQAPTPVVEDTPLAADKATGPIPQEVTQGEAKARAEAVQ